jgi:large subunit ribosomal protein L1
MNKQDIVKSIQEAKKQKERKFKESVDLIINLQKFDLKKESINLTITLPHVVKNKKVCGFFENESTLMDTIKQEEFQNYKDKKKLKKLGKKYDFFLANVKLMPNIASTFGRVLGPLGKMPSPQAGIVPNEDEKTIKGILEKMDKIIKIRTKEASIKLSAGSQEMDNEKIADNVLVVYNSVLNALPRKAEQIKSVMIKTTMGKPVKIKLK